MEHRGETLCSMLSALCKRYVLAQFGEALLHEQRAGGFFQHCAKSFHYDLLF